MSPIAEGPSRFLWFPPRMLQSVKKLPGEKIQTFPELWAAFYKNLWGFLSFLLPLGSGHSKVFTYLLISSVSPKRKSNTHPTSAERTRSEIQDSKWAEQQSDIVLPPQGCQVLKARGSSTEESHVECEGAWILDKNNMELKQPGFLCLRLLQPFSQLRNAQIFTHTSGCRPGESSTCGPREASKKPGEKH